MEREQLPEFKPGQVYIGPVGADPNDPGVTWYDAGRVGEPIMAVPDPNAWRWFSREAQHRPRRARQVGGWVAWWPLLVLVAIGVLCFIAGEYR